MTDPDTIREALEVTLLCHANHSDSREGLSALARLEADMEADKARLRTLEQATRDRADLLVRLRTLEDALERTKDGAETPESDAQHEPGRATAVELGNTLFAADRLADAYGRMWARDEKYYAYMDARAALAAAETPGGAE